MHAEIYMSAHILYAICARLDFPGLEWAWSLTKTILKTYFKLLTKCSFKGVITHLSNHFVTLVYKMIFERDPPYMSNEAMEALIGIVDWYASPSGTFIWMYNAKKPPHVLPKFAL